MNVLFCVIWIVNNNLSNVLEITKFMHHNLIILFISA